MRRVMPECYWTGCSECGDECLFMADDYLEPVELDEEYERDTRDAYVAAMERQEAEADRDHWENEDRRYAAQRGVL